MKACLTGSRVYGTPRPDSDLDCVILVEHEDDWDLLCQNEDYGAQKRKISPFEMSHTQGGYCGRSLRYGKMNVVAILKDPRVFEAWEKGTAFLKSIKPVTKEQACLVLESMFNVAQNHTKSNSASTNVDM